MMSESLIIAHSQGKYLANNFSLEDGIDVIFESGADLDRLRQLIPTNIEQYKVIVVLAGINDIIHGWNSTTVIRRFQRLYESLRLKNSTAQVAISAILPRSHNRWYSNRPGQEERNRLQQMNDTAKIVNWRISEVCSLTEKLSFISWPEFSSSSEYLLAKDGLHLSHEGTYILSKKFQRVCREFCRKTPAIVQTDTTLATASPVAKPAKMSATASLEPKPERTLVTAAHQPKPAKLPAQLTAKTSGTTSLAPNRAKTSPTASPQSKPVKTSATASTESKPVKKSAITASVPKPSVLKTSDSVTYSVDNEMKDTKLTISPVKQNGDGGDSETDRIVLPSALKTSDSVTYGVDNEMKDTKLTISPVKQNGGGGDSKTDCIVLPSALKTSDSVTYGVDNEMKDTKLTISPVKQNGGGGDLPAVIYTETDSPFSYQEAINILSSCVKGEIPENKISFGRPLSPLSGQTFLIDTENFKNKLDRRCDNYLWKHDGSKKYPKNKSPVIQKHTHKIKVQVDGKYKASSDFVRYEYQLLDNDRFFLVQYLGDNTVFRALSHKNSKSSGAYYRTCPSVLEEIQAETKTYKTGGKIYEKMKSKNLEGEANVSGIPRNLMQVHNQVRKEKEKNMLSHDSFYNAYQLHYHLTDFVLQLDVAPNLACVLGLKEVITDFNNLLHLKRDGKLLCSYDTTYNCGDFYISPIVFKHPLFDGEPTIPLAFLIHEKRDQEFHERLFFILKKFIPNLNKDSIMFVVDREPAITNAIENMLPQATILHCWNHIKRDVRYWLVSRKTPSDEIAIYMTYIDRLLKCTDVMEMETLEEELTAKWSSTFLHYYQTKIKPDICKYSGRWLFESTEFYDPYSGITNNSSESFNKVLKWMNDYRKMPIDMMILTLFYTQNSHFAEVLRGRAGVGKYRLKKDYEYTRIDIKDLHFPHKYSHPDDIINQAKLESENLSKNIVRKQSDIVDDDSDCDEKRSTPTREVRNDNAGTQDDPSSDEVSNFSDSEFEVDLEQRDLLNDVKNVTALADKTVAKKKGKPQILSQHSLAQTVVKNDGVKIVPSLKAFLVEGVRGSKYAVTLYPEEKCQCPSTGQCYHLMAVKISLGIPLNSKPLNKKETQSVALMKYRSRPRKLKRLGQKKPKPSDFEVIPPSDTKQFTNSFTTVNESIRTTSKTTSTPQTDTTVKTALENLDQSSIKKTLVRKGAAKRSLTFDTIYEETSALDMDAPESKRKRLSLSHRRKMKAKSILTDTLITENVNISVIDNVADTCSPQNNNFSVINNETESETKKSSTTPNVDPLFSNHESRSLSEPNVNACSNTLPITIDSVEKTNKNKRLSLKLPKKTKSGVLACDFSRTPSTPKVWIRSLGLTNSDRDILLTDGWLNDKHMSAVNSILRKQFPGVNGMQDTTCISHFSDSQGKWIPHKKFNNQTAPSGQIHYTGSNHWVFSCQLHENNEAIYLDSLMSDKSPNNNLLIQMSQIYGKSYKKLNVHIPKVQQQPNSFDCGLFAIAHLVEFCLAGSDFNPKYNFDVPLMRNHLLQCIENQKFEPFPKQSSRLRNVKINVTKKVKTVDLWCVCGMPEFFDNMVGCENRKCRKWFHRQCVGLQSSRCVSWNCLACGEKQKCSS